MNDVVKGVKSESYQLPGTQSKFANLKLKQLNEIKNLNMFNFFLLHLYRLKKIYSLTHHVLIA